MISPKLIANAFGATFVVVGLFGFLPNPIVSPDGIFAVNAAHNLLHVIVGAAFLIGNWLGHARSMILALGLTGVVLAALGFVSSNDMLLGIFHINDADRWLHALFAGIVLGFWWISREANYSGTSAKSSSKRGK